MARTGQTSSESSCGGDGAKGLVAAATSQEPLPYAKPKSCEGGRRYEVEAEVGGQEQNNRMLAEIERRKQNVRVGTQE